MPLGRFRPALPPQLQDEAAKLETQAKEIREGMNPKDK
jgi:hypothetical protein